MCLLKQHLGFKLPRGTAGMFGKNLKQRIGRTRQSFQLQVLTRKGKCPAGSQWTQPQRAWRKHHTNVGTWHNWPILQPKRDNKHANIILFVHSCNYLRAAKKTLNHICTVWGKKKGIILLYYYFYSVIYTRTMGEIIYKGLQWHNKWELFQSARG